MQRLGWLPIFFYSGLRVPTDGTTASFHLSEHRYKELARDVMEQEADSRFFLCCDGNGQPRTGGRATVVRLESCEWTADNESANIVVRGVQNIRLTNTRTDGERRNLLFGKGGNDNGVSRVLAFFRR